MKNDEYIRSVFVLLHVNSGRYMGRWHDHWTRGDIGSASIYPTFSEADQALQALLAEASDRLSNREGLRSQMWFDIHGGLVTVVGAEYVIRRTSEPPPADDAVDPADEQVTGDPRAQHPSSPDRA